MPTTCRESGNFNVQPSSGVQVRGSPRVKALENEMTDRQWLGDLSLAVLLALPLLALARPQPVVHKAAAAPAAVNLASADRVPTAGRIGLFS